MFGLLNEAEQKASLDPSDYERRRGRFYLIWNASKISGRPMLVALMAGNAAHDAEWTDTTTLMTEATERLRTVFGPAKVPAPLEVIVTRWRRDPFTRGTYSYVGPETRPGDYDLMSKSVGNLHFAGEATCGTHPATVHGAFLSGLRVAAEVMDDMAGQINLPSPLVGPPPVKQEMMAGLVGPQQPALYAPGLQEAATAPTLTVTQATRQAIPYTGSPIIKQEEAFVQLGDIPTAAPPLATGSASVKPAGPPAKSVCASDPSFWVAPSYDSSDLDYEAAVISVILIEIGDRPIKPTRPGVNPFLLFTKDKWEECKTYCAKELSNSGRDIIRQTIGKWWKAADDQAKQPYLVQSQTAQELADQVRRDWEVKVARWDKDATRIREEHLRDHPPPKLMAKGGNSNGVSKRRTNVSNCVVLDHL